MSDIDRLCQVIDAGDDSALLALADALEEMGDERAAGMRSLVPLDLPRWQYTPRAPQATPEGWRWWCVGDTSSDGSYCVRRSEFACLAGGLAASEISGENRYYPTRSAAYLALAQAIVATRKETANV